MSRAYRAKCCARPTRRMADRAAHRYPEMSGALRQIGEDVAGGARAVELVFATSRWRAVPASRLPGGPG